MFKMSILSVSDIILSFTLIINALALMSNKLNPQELNRKHRDFKPPSNHSRQQEQDANDGQGGDANEDTEHMRVGSEHGKVRSDSESDAYLAQTIIRIKKLLVSIRKLSCLLIAWNAVFLIMMIFVFS